MARTWPVVNMHSTRACGGGHQGALGLPGKGILSGTPWPPCALGVHWRRGMCSQASPPPPVDFFYSKIWMSSGKVGAGGSCYAHNPPPLPGLWSPTSLCCPPPPSLLWPMQVKDTPLTNALPPPLPCWHSSPPRPTHQFTKEPQVPPTTSLPNLILICDQQTLQAKYLPFPRSPAGEGSGNSHPYTKLVFPLSCSSLQCLE